ncbi:MAG: hypothetical protein J6I68_00900 [Butyrivibrio sp.]|uniref:hypothetical protein n=1 Tax=Butyrivibrio sp. TaxID=28121 RepID=UPI001B4BC179|nr:hypothetical protein [Butyrivibrio sp.]MBP3781785.1 hypothetical protein [Butyrivibrio sp.]
MGMYDTFWGTYTCLHCGKEVEFEEQTKDFECLLEDFKLGDYVDRGNRSYFYEFTYECPECHAETDLSIGIKKGQYVGVFLKGDAKRMDPEELENIEDGYQRKREYEKMCADKLGCETAGGRFDKLVALKPGDTLRVLETDWKILEAYYEEPRKGIMSMLHHPTLVYRAESEGVSRIITASVNPVMSKLYYRVFEGDLEHSEFVEWLAEHNPKRYAREPGSVLKEIPDGGVIWTADEVSTESGHRFFDMEKEMLGDGDGRGVTKDGDGMAKKPTRAIMYRNLEGDVEDLLSYVEHIEKQREEAWERVREWNKDSEIQQAEDKVKAAYKKLSRGFAPDDDQWEQIEKWEKKHAEKYHKPPKTKEITKKLLNGPNYSYQFEYSPIGTLGSVVCTVCAEKAMRNSLDSMSRYNELMERYNAHFSFGEV